MSLPKYQDIVDLIKKGATLEAQEKIIELRESALELQEENVELKEENRKLKENLDLKEKLHYDGKMYWINNEESSGGNEGPFCQRCYDVTGKLVRLQKSIRDFRRCLECESSIKTDK